MLAVGKTLRGSEGKVVGRKFPVEKKGVKYRNGWEWEIDGGWRGEGVE